MTVSTQRTILISTAMLSAFGAGLALGASLYSGLVDVLCAILLTLAGGTIIILCLSRLASSPAALPRPWRASTRRPSAN